MAEASSTLGACGSQLGYLLRNDTLVTNSNMKGICQSNGCLTAISEILRDFHHMKGQGCNTYHIGVEFPLRLLCQQDGQGDYCFPTYKALVTDAEILEDIFRDLQDPFPSKQHLDHICGSCVQPIIADLSVLYGFVVTEGNAMFSPDEITHVHDFVDSMAYVCLNENSQNLPLSRNASYCILSEDVRLLASSSVEELISDPRPLCSACGRNLLVFIGERAHKWFAQPIPGISLNFEAISSFGCAQHEERYCLDLIVDPTLAVDITSHLLSCRDVMHYYGDCTLNVAGGKSCDARLVDAQEKVGCCLAGFTNILSDFLGFSTQRAFEKGYELLSECPSVLFGLRCPPFYDPRIEIYTAAIQLRVMNVDSSKFNSNESKQMEVMEAVARDFSADVGLPCFAVDVVWVAAPADDSIGFDVRFQGVTMSETVQIHNLGRWLLQNGAFVLGYTSAALSPPDILRDDLELLPFERNNVYAKYEGSLLPPLPTPYQYSGIVLPSDLYVMLARWVLCLCVLASASRPRGL